ncbi:MAG: AEC family transporter [Clostridia bacterium]|nr:AEC family transporter [Clostridia bacterium]
MNSFFVALNAIMPTFLLLAFGYFLRQMHFVKDEFLKQTNTLVFKFFLPVLLFNNIYKTNLLELFDGTMFLFAIGSLLLLYAALCLIVPRVVREAKQRGVIIQAIFRSNYVIFGVSLVTNVFGEEHAAVASVLSAVLVPLYNTLSVVALAVYTSGEKVKFIPTVIKVVKNPLIIATLLGIAASFVGLRFPGFLETAVTDVARLATPLALIVLGGDFRFRRLKGNITKAMVAVVFKLVIIPVIFIPLAILAGIRGANLLALALAWETPTAVSSYIMAQEAGADSELAGQLVVLSSVCCIPTVFLMIFILQSFALL